jgi:hypothetical protein
MIRQCCGSGMFYPGSGSDHCSIPDPGGKNAPDPGSRIRPPFLQILFTYPGSRIRPLLHPGSRIPDPGGKKHRIPDPDPQHWDQVKW